VRTVCNVTNQLTDTHDPSSSSSSSSPARSPAPRRSIDLDVAGGDLMLRGRFHVWESGLALGPDLDRVGVRLAVDATSSAALAPGDDRAEADRQLFAFRSRSVESAEPGTYRARGTFTGSQGTKPLEVLVETPLGHSALFVLSFAADKHDFGDGGWGALVENVVPSADAGEGEPVRRAHAWLRPPVLAAA
jgi:hypothetical protein